MPTDPWPATLHTARRLEALGYHHLWVYDHLTWQRYRDRPWHATYPWLTGIAARTERIRLGTMVANPNIRHPLLLATDAMTIDHISGGRLILGVGAGGTGFDATVLGQRRLSRGERIERLGEYLGVLDGLLRGELHDHRGAYYEIVEARMLPGCVQEPRVPIAVAGGGRRSIRLAAEFGDAWITYGDSVDRDLSEATTDRIVVDQMRELEEQCVRIGRDASSVDRIYLIGNTEAQPLASLGAFTDFLGRYSEAGFTDLVFHHPRRDDPVWRGTEEIVEEIAEAHLS